MATIDELKKRDGSSVKPGALSPNTATGTLQLPGATLPEVFANSPQRLLGTPSTAPANNRSGADYIAQAPVTRGFAPTVAPVTQPAQTGGATGTWSPPVNAPVAPDAFADSRKVAGEVSRDVAGALDAGNYSGAVGRAARGYLATGVAGAVDAAGAAGGLLRPVGNLASNLFTGQDMASGASPGVATANPAVPAQPGTPAALAQPAAPKSAPVQAEPASTVGMPTPGQITKTVQPNGITSYSGTNVSSDINPSGNRGGVISAQNNQAAENLARSGGQTRGFGPSGAIRGGGQVSALDTSAGYAADRKQLAEIDAAKAAQEANMQAQADYAANKVLEGRALAGNRGALQIMGNNARNKTAQRGQDIQAGATLTAQQLTQENQRLAAAKDGREATAAGFTSRSAGRIEALQAAYETAKPEDRTAIAEQLRVLTGKEKPNKYTTVAGGQEWDAQANTMRNVPGRVFDNQTGRYVDESQGGAQAKAQPAPQQAVSMLKANPKMAAEFDAKYGPGQAALILGQK